MPVVNLTIRRAWRHRDEAGRIHYMIDRAGPNGARHLHVDEGSPLYDLLDDALLAQGYSGPASADPPR